MASVYSFCKDLVASIAVFAELLAHYFTTPLSEFTDGFPALLQAILSPLIWLIDLFTWGDATLLNLMFTVGVNIWIIYALYHFFKA